MNPYWLLLAGITKEIISGDYYTEISNEKQREIIIWRGGSRVWGAQSKLVNYKYKLVMKVMCPCVK